MCRRLASGQLIYEFEFTARPALAAPSVIFSSDRINLVVCAIKPSQRQPSTTTASDESAAAPATAENVLFIIRRVDTGDIVAKAKPNYPEFRYS